MVTAQAVEICISKRDPFDGMLQAEWELRSWGSLPVSRQTDLLEGLRGHAGIHPGV
jgi:hypothetical protein